MSTITVSFANVAGTEAAMGWAGSHTIVADRPEGKDGGMGLGFNGGQLLALSIGGCFCNDLRSIAHEKGIALQKIEVEVTLDLGGTPVRVRSAQVSAALETGAPEDARVLLDEARRITIIGNSVMEGFPVEIAARR
jgi:organic hydroperoxide reductase OsmC/OhrA